MRLSGGKQKLLQTDSEVYDLGDIVRVSALLLDENYKPIEIESQPVTIEHKDGTTFEPELKPDATAAGWYRSVFVPHALGEFHLRLPDGTETTIRVQQPDLEFEEPRLDEVSLRKLAEDTGGTYSKIWEAAPIPERIPDRQQTVVAIDEPIPLWDNALVMALLVGILTLEWILRKLNRLL